MTCPTILLQPFIRVTEAQPFGAITVHWDEPVTSYSVVMVGDAMHEVEICDEDGDGTGLREPVSMRGKIARLIAQAEGLTDQQASALSAAAFYPASEPLSLDDALAIHRATTRWAAEDYAAWAEQITAPLAAAQAA